MVLIVDDIRANIIALKKTLELHNIEVDSAESGEEALKKILKTEYSLIIMDVQMPGLDGFEVVKSWIGSVDRRWVASNCHSERSEGSLAPPEKKRPFAALRVTGYAWGAVFHKSDNPCSQAAGILLPQPQKT